MKMTIDGNQSCLVTKFCMGAILTKMAILKKGNLSCMGTNVFFRAQRTNDLRLYGDDLSENGSFNEGTYLSCMVATPISDSAAQGVEQKVVQRCCATYCEIPWPFLVPRCLPQA